MSSRQVGSDQVQGTGFRDERVGGEWKAELPGQSSRDCGTGRGPDPNERVADSLTRPAPWAECGLDRLGGHPFRCDQEFAQDPPLVTHAPVSRPDRGERMVLRDFRSAQQVTHIAGHFPEVA